MNDIVKKCKRCNSIVMCSPDYNVHMQNSCCGKLEIFNDINCEELTIMRHVSHDNDFILAMIDLKEKDIIEYNLKMSQIRTQIDQQKRSNAENDNVPRCPNCHSRNIQKISGMERAGSVMMLGVFSNKINKSFKCINCGYTW